MKIGFVYNVPSVISAGNVLIYDYAKYNQSLLNNESIILADENLHPLVYDKFRKDQNIILYDNWSKLEVLCRDLHLDAAYLIGDGKANEYVSGVSNIFHAVFSVNPLSKYDRYACVSEWLANVNNFPYWVPHIVDLPKHDENLRNELNIPQDAIVFGRHGSYDTFDLDFVSRSIERILQSKSDVYFLFMNTKPFMQHERVIYLDAITDPFEKVKFINTCDAMLHARLRGESFGLSVAEFSFCNKPVFTWWSSFERNHIDGILQHKGGIYYYDEQHLFDLMSGFQKQSEKDFVCTERFSPQIVMEQFKKVFLD